MADFSDVVEELRKANTKLDAIKTASDPSGSAAAEDAREESARAARSESYLKTIAENIGGGPGGQARPTAENEKAGGMLTGIAAALGKLGGGIGRGIGGFIKGIGSAASGAGQFAFVMGAVGAGIAAFITAIGAGSWAVSKMMPSIAEGLKSFDGIDGSNLGKVGKGMGHLGLGLASMGAGGAIAGVGNLIGGIADGIGGLFGAKSGQEELMEKLKKFSAVKLNVKNIKDNSEAMVAYGEAMAVGGGGKVLTAISTFTDGVFGGIGKMLGAVPPLESLKLFAKETVDKVAVKNNAEAMAEYTKAMALGAGAKGMEALGSIANFVATGVDGLSKLIGGKGTLDSQLEGMRKLSDAKGIDAAKIKLVVGALVEYTKAMGLGAVSEGGKAVASVGNFVSSAMDGLSKFVGGKSTLDSQLEGMKKLSDAKGIDATKIKLIVGALVEYTKAMGLGAVSEGGKAVASVGNFVGSAMDGLSKMIGGKGTLDAQLEGMRKLSDAKGIDTAKIKLVVEALVEYTKAMGLGAASEGGKLVGNIANFASGLVKGFGSLFGIKEADPLADLKKFSEYIITKEQISQIKLNAQGLEAYASAMSTMSGMQISETFGDTLSNIMTGIGSLFGGGDGKKKDPMTALQKFAGANIDGEKIKKDIGTLLSILEDKNISIPKSIQFKQLLTNIGEGLRKFTASGEGGFVDGLAGAATKVLNFLTGKKSPITEIKELASKSADLTAGAAAISSIGDGLDKLAKLKFDGSKLNIEEFAKDLMKSIPALEIAIMGGTVGKGWFASGTKIAGLANNKNKWEEAATNITLLKQALAKIEESVGVSAPPPPTPAGGQAGHGEGMDYIAPDGVKPVGGQAGHDEGMDYIKPVGGQSVPSIARNPSKPVRPSMRVRDYEGGYKDWKKAQDNYKRELKEWKSIKPLHKPDDKRANQINQAGMERGVAANATTIVNAPTSTVVDNKQSNTAISSTSFGHSNPALVAVNMAT